MKYYKTKINILSESLQNSEEPVDPKKLQELNVVLENVLQVSPIKRNSLRSKKSIDFKCSQIGKKAVAVAVGEELVDAATNLPSPEDSRILYCLKEK